MKYNSEEYIAKKNEILEKFGVTSKFNPASAVEARIEYLKRFIRNTGLKGFVLGISGGVDSSVVGKLCQLACEELRAEGTFAEFIAVRLPAGVQNDEADAQKAIAFTSPDKVLTVNIGETANLLASACRNSLDIPISEESADFNKGNAKARLRMASQYYIASVHQCAVIGTDHNSECVTGFYTKFGDGACDLIVLNGLIKAQVRAIAKYLGASDDISKKLPTADLEELKPGKLDDEGFGFPYSELDKFLSGDSIDIEIEKRIVALYLATQHKRDGIVQFN